MPAGFYAPSSEIEPVVGIQICVFSPDEIERRSVVEVTNSGTYEGNEPKIGGLFDPRMGVLDNGKECRSCGQTNHKCPGHFGHFRLARPVYYIQFLPFIQNILSCICIRCSKLLVDKKFRKHFLKRKGEARWRDVLTASKEIKRCGQETEDGCGARQPTRYTREGIARIVAEWDSADFTPTAADAAKGGSEKQRQPLEVEFVLRLFRRILDEDVDFMGFSRYWCRPDWMICTVLPIPPPQVRPSVIQDNNQRSEDDLTHKLAEIIKTNNTYLQPRIQANAAKSVIDEWTNVLQYHIATLVDNQIPGVAPSAQRNGRPLKSIQQRLGSKEGRIRYNIQGKRVEFSARSVITPDPNISIAELGVPEKIAMNLTRPERVTEFNRERLYKFIQNGPSVFPGAKTIRRGVDGRIISLRHVNTKDVVLHYGDIVNRHLMDGDIVLFNRQPTLHRMSMMAHKVKVLKYKTFRLNVSVTAPYNADFDGDEMNMHCPQSYEAATELEEIAAVPHQILRPRDGLPIIGVVQDTLVGSYRLTRDHVKFNRREFMNLMMWNKRFNGSIPEPKVGGKWSGHQILTELMPPINMEMMNSSKKKVVIRDGDVLEGQFDKSVFSKASKGIIHMTYNDYGSKETVDLLDAMQSTIEQFLIYNGFSVGISDLIADSATKDEMNVKIEEKKSEVESILLNIHQDLFDNNTGKTNQAEFEDKIFGILNKATELSGEIGYNSLANENRMTAMVRAGSKGGPINIAQMIACVGQQNIEGKRIPYGFEDRTLPHFKKYDDGAEARGFIQNSFINGLTPTEFFFHAMSGREGLIDTAVKSVTGDTKIVILEDGVTKCVAIGDWIDAHLSASSSDVEHFPDEADLEMLQLSSPTFIPSVAPNGTVSWGKVSAVTRHDPGNQLYRIETLGGRSVIVTASKSLLIWNPLTTLFENRNTPDVRPGDAMPVTMSLAQPPVITSSIKLESYLPKTSYLFGTDFHKARELVDSAMVDREHIPSGWWMENNGKGFTLPYENKGRFVRTLTRSKTDNILPGYVYPFTTNRDGARIPHEFSLNSENGLFLGLFLAEGNVDVKSGYVGITNNSPEIRQFVHDWFESNRIKTIEDTTINSTGGTTTTVRGFSTVLAKFLDEICGHGAANKRVPAEAFTAPLDFIKALLNGYISGDGTLTYNSIESGSASQTLTEGITMLLTRLGVFAKMFKTQLKSNNVATENILPTYRLSVRAQWATLLASNLTFIDTAKESKRKELSATAQHRNFPFQNDVVMDEIVSIELVSPEAYPKMYDLTVPETFTFGLANGLQVYDTADTGYIQRQLVKAMEDLVVQHDGSVRDANMNIAQFHYGEDGINSTKIENQTLDLAKLSREDIARDFGLEGVDLTTVLVEGMERGDDKAALKAYAEQIRQDQVMIVEGVFRSGSQGSVYSAVNLDRLILNIKIKFGLNDKVKTNLTPTRVLAGIEAVLDKTQRFHKTWAALLRYNMSPMKMIVRDRFTESAFDVLCEMLVTKNWQAWVQPGEQVGIIAAQSIGEPSTQMTLNSVDWDTKVMIAKNGEIVCPQIGEFIDAHMDANPEKIQTFPNNQLYMTLDDGNDWQAISCDENGKQMWTKLEAITRHPVVNEDGTNTILEVELDSGRTVKATKGKSFLTLIDGKVLDINGSELKVGDILPIANSLALNDLGIKETVSVRSVLPATEWMYGTDVHKALAAIETGDRHWFQKNQGTLFTLPYSRSDAFREAIVDGKNTNAEQIRANFVYPARTRPDVSQIPEEIPLTQDFGYFVGAYLAEGMANTTQVNITNNDTAYLERVNALMSEWNVGTHMVSEQREAEKTGIKGTSTSLVIHSTVLATVMQALFGRVSHEKTLPDWVFQAPDAFVHALVDAYISGDGTVCKKSGTVHATSVSKELLVRFSTLLARYGIFSTISQNMPELGKFDSVRMNYTINIPAHYSKVFAETFSLSIGYKQDILDYYHGLMEKGNKNRRQTTGDIVWDTIKSIKEVVPIKERVYDFTVETTRNFMTYSCLAVKDTFHLAGVASKSNVTRGVPRLKELLKVTQNPKAISLTIPLKKEYRNSKAKAREVSQELELTLLRDMTLKTAIYFDPKDSDTVLKEDRELLAFYRMFEQDTSAQEQPEGQGQTDAWSKYILRLELNRQSMFDKNITMDDILFVLRRRFEDEVQMVYSDFNSQKLVMRIRLSKESLDTSSNTDPSSLDALASYKKFQNKLLNAVIIRGLPGIKAATFRKGSERLRFMEESGKYETSEEYILDTDGSNFLEVMNHPAVDATRVTSTHVHDIYSVLGIEATRHILYTEITTLFEDGQINYRHLGLLVDVMTRAGRLMSVDRYGINKLDIGPLAKASFEETERILLKAAVFGEIDPITGVSANIMTGQPIRGGTAFSDILLDESAVLRLQKGLPPVTDYRAGREAPLTPADQVDDAEAEGEDACSPSRLRMNLTLPATKTRITDEPDIEFVELEDDE